MVSCEYLPTPTPAILTNYPASPHQHDSSIMEDALISNLPKSSILTINHCRITRQALYWSDIANGWGDSIFPSCLCPPANMHLSSWTWPPEKPSHSDWAIWSTFLCDSPQTAGGYFILPLGQWSRPIHQRDFIPFCTKSQSAFLKAQAQFWRVYSMDSSRSYHFTKSFPFRTVTASLPPINQLAWIEYHSDQSLTLSGSSPVSPLELVPPDLWPLHLAHFPHSGAPIAASILAGTALAISDGSFMPKCFPHLAATAWIIHPGLLSVGHPCHGVTPVHGQPSVIISYRAELQGLHALLLAVNHICMSHHLHSRVLTIGCDNQGVLHHA